MNPNNMAYWSSRGVTTSIPATSNGQPSPCTAPVEAAGRDSQPTVPTETKK
jgi:hypothetical protein